MKRNLLIILIITSGTHCGNTFNNIWTMRLMILNHYFYFLFLSGVFGADQIGPNDQETDVFRKEGESVTLKCSYDSSSESVALFWYRQYPNRALQFILWKGARQESSSHIPDDRFSSTTSRYSTELTVGELRLADTALYYCALWSPVIQSL